jgi:hypothetical protein
VRFGRWRVFVCPNVSHQVRLLAGGNQHVYIASIKDRFNLGEVILGEFLDALRAGQQAKQKRIEVDQLEAAIAQKKVNDDLDAARKWVSGVLGPVAVEVHNDLKSLGEVTIEQISRPLLVGSVITIDLDDHEPTKLSFHVQVQTGSVSVFRDSENGKPLGEIAVVSRRVIENLFRETIESIGQA